MLYLPAQFGIAEARLAENWKPQSNYWNKSFNSPPDPLGVHQEFEYSFQVHDGSLTICK